MSLTDITPQQLRAILRELEAQEQTVAFAQSGPVPVAIRVTPGSEDLHGMEYVGLAGFPWPVEAERVTVEAGGLRLAVHRAGARDDRASLLLPCDLHAAGWQALVTCPHGYGLAAEACIAKGRYPG